MTQTMSDEEINAVLAEDQADDHDVREDPEAPYGRNPRTGKPYTMPPEARAELGARLADARRASAGGGSRKTRSPRKRATAAAPRAPERPDYISGAKALLQLPAFALAIAGRYKPAFLLDSATITLHADAIATALGETALEQQWLADVLDKAMAITPAGRVLGVLLPLGMQIGANHGKIAPNPELGILTPDQLMAALNGTS